MESSRKLTLDIIKQYISNNLNHFTNDEYLDAKQSSVMQNVTKKIKQEPPKQEQKQQEHIPKSLSEYLITDKKTLSFPINFFAYCYSTSLLENFLIFNQSCQIDIKDQDKSKDQDININTLSFYYALLSAMEPSFSSESKDNKFILFNNLMNYLKKDIMIDGFKQHQYSKLKWTKNDIFKSLEKNEVTDKIIRYVSDALHINIFCIDYKTQEVNYYGGDFIVFKKIAILMKHDNKYYLVYDTNNKLFSFNSNDFIKNIITNPGKLNLVFVDNFNPVGSDWNKYMNLQDKTQNNTPNQDDQILYTDKLNGYDIDEDTVVDNKNQEVIQEIRDEYINDSMSLIELQKKAKELNIDVFHNVNGVRKIKNKKELCREILNK